MRKILVTGGAVHAYLDAVKIITNRFKGGLIASLAEAMAGRELDSEVRVTYLTSKDAKQPTLHQELDHCAPSWAGQGFRRNLEVVYHDGFDDYMKKVLELAPTMDAVILGAAVANLIPKNPIKGKFPSHNFKPGDTIPIDFTIAPRVINEVRKVAPKTVLFGFKLLSGVPHEELIHAAYTVVLESGAAAVFANDAQNLQRIYAVTKERAIHPMDRSDLAKWILPFLSDEYYKTLVSRGRSEVPDIAHYKKIGRLMSQYKNKYFAVEDGYVFGTIAVRVGGNTFLTTGRGKKELLHLAVVNEVDHAHRIVYVDDAGGKASLNAPLLSRIFELNPRVGYIVHYHEQYYGLVTVAYAPPGTVRDTERFGPTSPVVSFNVEDHGCYLLFDKEGNML